MLVRPSRTSDVRRASYGQTFRPSDPRPEETKTTAVASAEDASRKL